MLVVDFLQTVEASSFMIVFKKKKVFCFLGYANKWAFHFANIGIVTFDFECSLNVLKQAQL